MGQCRAGYLFISSFFMLSLAIVSLRMASLPMVSLLIVFLLMVCLLIVSLPNASNWSTRCLNLHERAAQLLVATFAQRRP